MITTLGTIINTLAESIYEGKTGNELEKYAKLLMQIHKVEPAFKGYTPKGFPATPPFCA